MSQAPLRVAVAGAGAFGKNHLRVLRELEAAGGDVTLIAAVEPSAERADEVVEQYGIPVFSSVSELLKTGIKMDAAFVA
ncbi:MAG TPA: Gfo/Idh/MocA family oxidoreductase, partial [Terracidiphilus sp.]|nr:Gfo/Idh/MocA family oxidoreductase [Terracidiphilus sp.]